MASKLVISNTSESWEESFVLGAGDLVSTD